MKTKLIAICLILMAMSARADYWTNYPFATVPGLNQTFQIGDTVGNYQMRASAVSNWIGEAFLKIADQPTTNGYLKSSDLGSVTNGYLRGGDLGTVTNGYLRGGDLGTVTNGYLRAPITTNSIDATFYTFITDQSGTNTGGSGFPLSNDADFGGFSATNMAGIQINGATTNFTLTLNGGGYFTVTNPATTANLVVPPSGPVTAKNGFDIGTNTGNITIQGNITVSNTIIVGAFYTLTNSAPAGIVPMGESDYATNGVVVYTGLKLVNAGTYNYGVQHVLNTSGAVNPITPAVSWKSANGVWFVTNGGQSVVSVYVGPSPAGGIETNAICYPIR